MVSRLLKGTHAQDTHAARCWLKVEHALLHGAQAQDTAVVKRWWQVEHTLHAILWQTARPAPDAVLRQTWHIQQAQYLVTSQLAEWLSLP